MNIAFVGLSHLGIVSAVSAATKGVRVTCFDSDVNLILNLRDGRLHVEEPGLREAFDRYRENLYFTYDLDDLRNCPLVYISFDVPTNSSDTSDLASVKYAIKKCIEVLQIDSNLILLSQVPPGFSRLIQNDSSIQITYQVETLIFGNALERANKPDRFLIGVAGLKDQISKAHLEFLRLFEVPIIKMNYESAELAKISINIFLATSISTTNTLAELSVKLGANWDHVREALQSDPRIGQFAYTRPGLGISGGNLERDLATAFRLTQLNDTNPEVLLAIINSSKHYKLWPSRVINSLNDTGDQSKIIAVWGVSYKRNTHSLKNAPSIENLRVILKHFQIRYYDPIVKKFEIDNRTFFSTENPLETLDGADILVIFNDSEIFKTISQNDIRQKMRGDVVLDPLGVLAPFHFHDMQYFTVGK